jgi:hypothetical protein
MTALLTQREAATILRLSTRTLERLRVTGTGPKFIRIGNPSATANKTSMRMSQRELLAQPHRRSHDENAKAIKGRTRARAYVEGCKETLHRPNTHLRLSTSRSFLLLISATQAFG